MRSSAENQALPERANDLQSLRNLPAFDKKFTEILVSQRQMLLHGTSLLWVVHLTDLTA